MTLLLINATLAPVAGALIRGASVLCDGDRIAQVGTDHFTGVNAVMGSLFGDVINGSGASDVFMGRP